MLVIQIESNILEVMIMKSFAEIGKCLERRAPSRAVVTYNNFAKEVGAPPVNNLWENHPLRGIFGDLGTC
jgi:hypothetical protein